MLGSQFFFFTKDLQHHSRIIHLSPLNKKRKAVCEGVNCSVDFYGKLELLFLEEVHLFMQTVNHSRVKLIYSKLR
jgi:hypothetical protein